MRLVLLLCLIAICQPAFAQQDSRPFLAALEINGWQIADGARVFLTRNECGIKRDLDGLEKWLRVDQLPQRDGFIIFSNPDARCAFDPAKALMRIVVDPKLLVQRTLRLNEDVAPPPANDSIRLLPSLALDSYIDDKTQVFSAALAVDRFIGRATGLGPNQPASGRRYSVEYTGADRMQLVAGDLRVTQGIVAALRDVRGVYYTSIAAPLRESESLAEAIVSVTAPSRTFFLAENGQRLTDSGLLPPGNYRLQGSPTNALPGQLEAVVQDQDGRERRILLPWSKSKRLLSEDRSVTEAFIGKLRKPDQTLYSQLSASINHRRGISLNETVQVSAESSGQHRLLAAELSTSRWRNTIVTAGVGAACGGGCQPSYFFESNWQPSKVWQLYAQATRWADVNDDALSLSSRQFGVTLTPRDTLSFAVAYGNNTQNGISSNQTVFSAYSRFFRNQSLVAQVRRSVEPSGVSWGSYIGLVLTLDALPRWTFYPNVNSASGSQTRAQLGFSSNQVGPYGLQLNGAVSAQSGTGSYLFGRYLSPYGEVFANSVAGRVSGGLTSRLWITPVGTYLAPYTDSNLVIADVGLQGVKARSVGNEFDADDQGRVALRRVAPWSDIDVAINAENVPININVNGQRLRLSTELDRAYQANFRNAWHASYSWQALHQNLPLSDEWQVVDGAGQRLFIGARGFIDLLEERELIAIAPDRQRYQCQLQAAASADSSIKKLLCDSLLP